MQRRNGYREGLKGVQVWVSLALHGQVKAGAAAEGLSMNEWVLEAIREKVSRDAGDDRQGVGRDAGADRRVSGPVEGGVREGAPRVGAGDGGKPRLTVADLDALVSDRLSLVRESDEFFTVDPFGDDARPVQRDARGRVPAPVVRDEWIDTA